MPSENGTSTKTAEVSEVFRSAEAVVHGERRDAYGPVTSSFERIAKVWSVVLGHTITSQQVALCMIGMKLVREAHAHKDDNLVDICGYVLCLTEMPPNNMENSNDIPKEGTHPPVRQT